LTPSTSIGASVGLAAAAAHRGLHLELLDLARQALDVRLETLDGVRGLMPASC
jgi:hypothetical protein